MTERPIRVLYINLSSRSFEVKVHSDLSQWLGGVGLGRALLFEHLEDDPFILSIGPLCGLFPASSKTVATFISPLTGSLGESIAGGALGVNLRRSGLDAVFVWGKSRMPVVLEIKDGGVRFSPAGDLWGKTTSAALAALSPREGAGTVSVLTIGPAAEAGVRFADVFANGGWRFSRLGLGRLWAKKKLKGMVISSTGEVACPSSDRFVALRGSLEEDLSDPTPEGLRFKIQRRGEDFLALAERAGGLPARNYQKTGVVNKLFGNYFFREQGCRSCADCSVECCAASYPEVVSLGPLLGLERPEEVSGLLKEAYELGVDPVSLGAALAWLTESEGWEFGDSQSYQSLTQALKDREEDWAKALSLGLLRAAKGKRRDFALVLSGLEAAPYFGGYLSLLAQIVVPGWEGVLANAALLDFAHPVESFSVEEWVDKLIWEEKKTLSLSCLVTCHLVQKLYELPTVFSCLESLGLSWSHQELESLPDSVYNLGWEIRDRLGFSWDDIRIPERVFETKVGAGYLERGRLEGMVEAYRDFVVSGLASG